MTTTIMTSQALVCNDGLFHLVDLTHLLSKESFSVQVDSFSFPAYQRLVTSQGIKGESRKSGNNFTDQNLEAPDVDDRPSTAPRFAILYCIE